MTELSLKVSKTIYTTPEKAFDAWLDAEQLSRIMLPKPDMPNPKVTNSPVQGGEFEILMDVGDRVIPHTGTYLEIDRPNRLVFSWHSPFSVEGSTVTIEFIDQGNGQTKVVISHVKFPNQESRDNHHGGWRNILEALEKFLD